MLNFQNKGFNEALGFGQTVESIVLRTIAERNPQDALLSAPNCNFKDWDIKQTKPNGKQYTYEVKADTYAKDKGRFFLEFGKIAQGTHYKSGLALTKADYLVLVAYGPLSCDLWFVGMDKVGAYINEAYQAKDYIKTKDNKLGAFLTTKLLARLRATCLTVMTL